MEKRADQTSRSIGLPIAREYTRELSDQASPSSRQRDAGPGCWN
jgi:hypothetical protein